MTDYDFPIPPNPNPENDIDIESELDLPDDTGQERSIARWLAMQVLYEIDCADHPHGQALAHHLRQYAALQPATVEYTVKLVNGVMDNIERLDMILQTIAQEYPLDQIAIVDRNVLRSAVYEYAMLGGIPVGVVIDEAVQLAKRFGAESAPRFVNGVLGAVFKDEKRLQAMLEVELPEEDDDEFEDEDDETDERREDEE